MSGRQRGTKYGEGLRKGRLYKTVQMIKNVGKLVPRQSDVLEHRLQSVFREDILVRCIQIGNRSIVIQLSAVDADNQMVWICTIAYVTRYRDATVSVDYTQNYHLEDGKLHVKAMDTLPWKHANRHKNQPKIPAQLYEVWVRAVTDTIAPYLVMGA